jgi:hypothetical protein
MKRVLCIHETELGFETRLKRFLNLKKCAKIETTRFLKIEKLGLNPNLENL